MLFITIWCSRLYCPASPTSGPAPSEEAKSRATQIAAGPKGVMRVENRLEVKAS